LFSSAATGVASWNWNFGNGTGTNVPPFSRTYNAPGPQTILLIVKDINGCGSLPASNIITVNPAPPIGAGPDKFIKLGSSTTLDAVITNPANYDYLWSPSVFLNSAIILNPVSTPDKPMTYTIQATDKLTNCTANATVIITTVSDIYIPNSFTPNNDGKNDKWVIPGLALYPEAVVSVYNRAGQKIFESKGYISNPWNGTYKGVPQPTGVYVYLVQLNDDKKQLFKGTVAIIR
jgi:gliding motility-associated-like protein